MFETLRQNSAYRSVRYSTVRKDSYTADNSNRLSLFRVKKKPIEQSTFYQTRTIDLKPQTATANMFDSPEKSTYMQTFTSMFHSERKVKEKSTNNEESTLNNYGIKLKFTNFDSNFLKDDDGTQFTLLDPFHRPYTYLINQLSKQEKELRSQKDDIRLLRAQLNIMKRNVITSLKESEEEGKKGIDRLRQCIRKNQVESQELKMRVRREMTELFEQHDSNTRIKDEILDRSKGMQRDIFNCQPFELEVQAQ